MEKFNYNDFVSDCIPGCSLNKSSIVRQVVERALEKAGKPPATIQSINLVGLVFQREILLEWHVTITEANGPIRLAVYIPRNKNLAMQQVKKHYQAALQKNLQEIRYNPGDYFLINYKYPCQLICDEKGDLHIKRFTIIPSQKIAQELLTDVLQCDLVTATLVVTTFHTLYYKGMNDICWLLNLDGIPSLISLDRIHTEMGLFKIDKYEEFPEGNSFELNCQKYIVECDEENGLYIAKISKPDRHKT